MRSIRFHLFEIKRVLVYNSTILKLTDWFILYFFIQNVYAEKNYLRKKAKILCTLEEEQVYITRNSRRFASNKRQNG